MSGQQASIKSINKHLHNEDDILFFDSEPFTGVLDSNEENGRVEKRYYNGLLHGVQKTFYPSGQIKNASVFTNGVENGRRIEYYECGSKKLNASFSNGKQSGIYEEWDKGGRLKSRKTYYQGKLIAIKAKNFR